jgi:membrane-associated phospholipid phosphatase
VSATVHSRWLPFDYLVFGYSLLLVVVVLMLGRPLADYADELVFYLGTAVVAVICVYLIEEDSGGLRRLLRLGYPLLLFPFFYRMTGGTVHMLFPEFLDPQLTNFEAAILGVNPTLFIDQHLLNIVVDEFFSFCYFAYYLLVPIFFVATLFKGPRSVFVSSLTAVCATFFVSYLLFILFPLEGPRYHFAGSYLHELNSIVFYPLTRLVIDKGAIHGGCMPSSHFAVALVILLYCFRHYRRTAWWLLPLVAGLAVGTVWGRFHYVSDVVAGGAIGAVVTVAVWRRERTSKQRDVVVTQTLAGSHVS